MSCNKSKCEFSVVGLIEDVYRSASRSLNRFPIPLRDDEPTHVYEAIVNVLATNPQVVAAVSVVHEDREAIQLIDNDRIVFLDSFQMRAKEMLDRMESERQDLDRLNKVNALLEHVLAELEAQRAEQVQSEGE